MLEKLPDELALRVLAFANAKTRARAGRVSRVWRKLSNDEVACRDAFLREYPHNETRVVADATGQISWRRTYAFAGVRSELIEQTLGALRQHRAIFSPRTTATGASISARRARVRRVGTAASSPALSALFATQRSLPTALPQSAPPWPVTQPSAPAQNSRPPSAPRPSATSPAQPVESVLGPGDVPLCLQALMVGYHCTSVVRMDPIAPTEAFRHYRW